MEQIAQVTRTFPDGTAEVLRVRENACSGDCHACSGCGAHPQSMLMTVQNPIGAKAGDRVILTAAAGAAVKAAMLLYLVPLVLFLAAYLLGEHLWGRGPLVSICGFVVGMALVKLYDKHITTKNTVYTITAFGPKNTNKGDNEVD